MNTQDPTHWHLDKKVPITLLVALMVNFTAGIWWASKLEARVSAIDQQIVAQRERDLVQDRSLVDARIERNARLDRIEDKLDRLIGSLQRPGK